MGESLRIVVVGVSLSLVFGTPLSAQAPTHADKPAQGRAAQPPKAQLAQAQSQPKPRAKGAPRASASDAAKGEAVQAPTEEPSEEQREAARTAYATGQAEFAKGNFEAALAAFEEAYAAVPNPIVLFSIGESQLQLGRLDEAVVAYERYLEQRPDAPERAGVEQKIRDLNAIPATLAISSDPPGAAIEIDGKATGKVTPAEIEVMRGVHKLRLSRDGYQDTEADVEAKLGVRLELAVELLVEPAAPEPVAEPEPEPESEPAPPPPEPPTGALWVTGIVSAAGLISGTVLGFMALSERSDFDANPTAASADRGERLALFADVSFGIGAMAILTGAVLYLTSDQPLDRAPETDGVASSEAAAFSLQPAVTSDGAGLSASGRF